MTPTKQTQAQTLDYDDNRQAVIWTLPVFSAVLEFCSINICWHNRRKFYNATFYGCTVCLQDGKFRAKHCRQKPGYPYHSQRIAVNVFSLALTQSIKSKLVSSSQILTCFPRNLMCEKPCIHYHQQQCQGIRSTCFHYRTLYLLSWSSAVRASCCATMCNSTGQVRTCSRA